MPRAIQEIDYGRRGKGHVFGVCQPTYAAYLNLFEPRWKTLRSLALQGNPFATWGESI